MEIIQLHNKSLDQLVLDTKENNNEEKEELVLSDINSSDLEEGSNQPNETKINEEEITVTSDEVNEVESQTIFDLSENNISTLRQSLLFISILGFVVLLNYIYKFSISGDLEDFSSEIFKNKILLFLSSIIGIAFCLGYF